jgi:hypothetical protein
MDPMTETEQRALDAFKRLPDAPREELAALMVDYASAWRKLTEKLARAAGELDAGEGIPSTEVFAELRAKHGA